MNIMRMKYYIVGIVSIAIVVLFTLNLRAGREDKQYLNVGLQVKKESESKQEIIKEFKLEEEIVLEPVKEEHTPKTSEHTASEESESEQEIIKELKLKERIAIEPVKEEYTPKASEHAALEELQREKAVVEPSETQISGPPPIDAVYLWVNGSDPVFIAKIERNKRLWHHNESLTQSSVGTSRFKDNGELFYSLRSLNMFAPWIRNIYILTSDGQIPYWLDIGNPRIKVIADSQIFSNKSNTPTFSSPAIEANMHNIPGLSDNFIQFNDDFFLGKPVSREDFLSSRGYNIKLAWDSPQNCKPTDDTYSRSLCNVNDIYNDIYGRVVRKVASHAPHMINRKIDEDLHARFFEQFETTSANRFRSPNDMQFQFSYFWFIIHEKKYSSFADALKQCDKNTDGALSKEELVDLIGGDDSNDSSGPVRAMWQAFNTCSFRASDSKVSSIQDIASCSHFMRIIDGNVLNQPKYKHEISYGKDVSFIMLSNDFADDSKNLEKIRTSPTKFISINDNRDHTQENDGQISELYLNFLETMFPKPSPFEYSAGRRNTLLYIGD